MKNNYLLIPINQYFEESTTFKGDLLAISSILKQYESISEFKGKEPKDLMALITHYRDISQVENGPNLHFTGYSFRINQNNLNESIIRIESRESLLAIAQIYEIFESYLKNIISAFFENNQKHLNDILLLRNLHDKSKSPKDFINKIQREEKNNRKLLWTLRKLSNFYQDYENENNHNIPFSIWFDLISDIRHLVIHKRQKVSSLFAKSLYENNKQKLFDRYFEIKSYNEINYISTNRMNAGNLVMHLNSFAYFIFKALSIELNLNPNYIKL